jgi:uncharacterized coiled-coil protein SlyX
MENQISEYTITELKAIAYDQLAILEQTQNNIRVINQELAKRQPQATQNPTAVN